MKKKYIKTTLILMCSLTLLILSSNNTSNAFSKVESYGNANANFNRYNSMTYQDVYYSSHNPDIEYIDGANCTNWASQTLLGGGMSQISSYSSPSKDTDIRNWYYQPKKTIFDKRCESFVIAEKFRNHWGVDVNGNGNKRANYSMITTLRDWYNNWDYYGSKCSPGDILQVYYPDEDKPYHSMVVYYTDMDEDGMVYEITITENSRDAKTGFAEIFLNAYNSNPDAKIGLIRISQNNY